MAAVRDDQVGKPAVVVVVTAEGEGLTQAPPGTLTQMAKPT